MKSGLTRCPTLTAPLFPGVSMLPFRCDPGGGRKQQVSCRVARLKEPAPAVFCSWTLAWAAPLYFLFHSIFMAYNMLWSHWSCWVPAPRFFSELGESC